MEMKHDTVTEDHLIIHSRSFLTFSKSMFCSLYTLVHFVQFRFENAHLNSLKRCTYDDLAWKSFKIKTRTRKKKKKLDGKNEFMIIMAPTETG